jgi:hypothetical protein
MQSDERPAAKVGEGSTKVIDQLSAVSSQLERWHEWFLHWLKADG